MTTDVRFPRFRPLYRLSLLLDRLAFAGVHRPSFPAIGTLRYRIEMASLALGWMARGNQWDTRSLRERLSAGNYFWRAAVRR